MKRIPCKTDAESAIKKEMKDWLDSEGIFWSMVKGGAYSKKGDPDMIICVDGRYVAIEGKTEDGQQSNIQKTRMRQIRASGGVYAVARDLDELKETVERVRNEIAKR